MSPLDLARVTGTSSGSRAAPAGLAIRLAAGFLDLLVFACVGALAGLVFHFTDLGQDRDVVRAFDLSFRVLGFLYVVGSWAWKGATPGKAALGLRIVDARTGGRIGVGKALLRYIGYVLSTMAAGIGFLWIAFDARKMGWHDHLARTAVVRVRPAVRAANDDRRGLARLFRRRSR